MNENRDLLEKTVVEIASLNASQITELKELVKDQPGVSETLEKVLNIIARLRISTRLVELRGDRTQEEVATAIAVSPNAYALYESGERIPRAEIKQRIADFYGCSINSIFYA